MLRKLAILLALAPWVALAQQNVNFASTGTVDSEYQNVKVYVSVVGTTSTIWFGAPIPPSTAPIYSAGAPTATCSSVINANVYGINTSTSPWSYYICATGLSGYGWYPIGGGGGSSGISGLTSGYIPLAGSASTLTGNSPLDYNITAAGWLTSSVKLQVPQLGVGSSGTQTAFTVTEDTVADLLTNYPCSTHGPVTVGSTIRYWRAEVYDALNYSSPITGGGSIHLWAWCDGTNWNSSLPPPSGLADPGSNGIVKRTAANITAAATASDIAAIFPALSGDCATSANSTVTNCAHGFTTLTDTSPIAWVAAGNISNAVVTLAHGTGTRALNISGLASGDYGTLIVKQDSTGGANITGGTGCTWYVGQSTGGYIATSTFFSSAPSANAVDIIAWTYNGTNCYANVR